MNKEHYCNAELEVVKLDLTDVIATSSDGQDKSSTKYVDFNGWD